MRLYNLVGSAVFCRKKKIACWVVDSEGRNSIAFLRGIPKSEVLEQIRKDCLQFLSMYN